MRLKNKIIEILEKNRDCSISGQELADKLSVSRTAVWKTIQSLEKDGYIIDASTNKGYKLNENSDIISYEGIKIFLSEKYKKFTVQIYKILDSTNTYAKKIIIDGAKHGTIIIANEQKAGRGRFGRTFFSPADTGIYLSIILKPQKKISDTSLITIAAAVAVCDTIKKTTCSEPKIKWVNDIFLNGKKICGILTEAVSDFESGIVESAVTGIGINIKTAEERFPEDLKRTAGSLFPENISRNQIIAELINNFFELYENLSDKNLIERYKEYSLVLGKEITYFKDDKTQTGTAVDINENGNLIIKDKNKKTSVLESGEVTLNSKKD
ncbi:MAG: biotin--[acetyl-CoA-carboxylase] ligase [Endomicrobiaceae bacterium]|jgi:BirA family biotin operon repressor/biotin-[acetyl-CoA-carboxylase] ligase|nr:biotin--[acetyl-CoA-carboxylase] ligase [Endomicrobiaceae bacterium]